MPRLHSSKPYVAGGYYHIYNRGVNKQRIFNSSRDYYYFMSLLAFYLCPSDIEAIFSAPSRRYRRSDQNLSSQIELVTFCLMPNHFHMLIRQNSDHAITKFTKQLNASYAKYFNDRYNRVGHVYECSVKARIIDDTNDLLQVSSYIHRNPQNIEEIVQYPYSSMQFYATKTPSWLNAGIVQKQFRNNEEYLAFVQSQQISKELEMIYQA